MLERSGLAGQLGEDNIVPAQTVLFASIEGAVELGRAWIRDKQAGDGL